MRVDVPINDASLFRLCGRLSLRLRLPRRRERGLELRLFRLCGRLSLRPVFDGEDVVPVAAQSLPLMRKTFIEATSTAPAKLDLSWMSLPLMRKTFIEAVPETCCHG